MQQRQRPTSVTAISWILIAMAALSIISHTVMLYTQPQAMEAMAMSSPLSVNLQLVIMYLGLSVQVISGLVMLLGRNWGRLLYVTWAGIGSLVSLVTAPHFLLIFGFILYGIFVFFLFRPKANQYFGK